MNGAKSIETLQHENREARALMNELRRGYVERSLLDPLVKSDVETHTAVGSSRLERSIDERECRTGTAFGMATWLVAAETGGTTHRLAPPEASDLLGIEADSLLERPVAPDNPALLIEDHDAGRQSIEHGPLELERECDGGRFYDPITVPTLTTRRHNFHRES
jgi:hypothetical protein